MRLPRVVLVPCLVAVLPLAACSSAGDDDSRAGTSTSVGPTTTVRPVDTSFTGQGSEQFCQFLATFSAGSQNVGPGASPAELEASFSSALGAINQAVEVAPGEIKPDVSNIADTFEKVTGSVAAAGYDIAKVDVAAVAPLQSEAFLDSVTRMQAYLNNVCQVDG